MISLNQTTLAPDQCTRVESLVNIKSIADPTGVIHPTPAFAEDKPIVLASSLSTVHERKVPIRITNTSPTSFTIKKNTVVAEFHITTPNEAKNVKILSTAALKVLTENDSEQALEYVNELLKTTEKLETSHRAGSQLQIIQATPPPTPLSKEGSSGRWKNWRKSKN